jgi:hypothetical protein
MTPEGVVNTRRRHAAAALLKVHTRSDEGRTLLVGSGLLPSIIARICLQDGLDIDSGIAHYVTADYLAVLSNVGHMSATSEASRNALMAAGIGPKLAVVLRASGGTNPFAEIALGMLVSLACGSESRKQQLAHADGMVAALVGQLQCNRMATDSKPTVAAAAKLVLLLANESTHEEKKAANIEDTSTRSSGARSIDTTASARVTRGEGGPSAACLARRGLLCRPAMVSSLLDLTHNPDSALCRAAVDTVTGICRSATHLAATAFELGVCAALSRLESGLPSMVRALFCSKEQNGLDRALRLAVAAARETFPHTKEHSCRHYRRRALEQQSQTPQPQHGHGHGRQQPTAPTTAVLLLNPPSSNVAIASCRTVVLLGYSSSRPLATSSSSEHPIGLWLGPASDVESGSGGSLMVVKQIDAGSIAAAASGLAVGDLVADINGQRVSDFNSDSFDTGIAHIRLWQQLATSGRIELGLRPCGAVESHVGVACAQEGFGAGATQPSSNDLPTTSISAADTRLILARAAELITERATAGRPVTDPFRRPPIPICKILTNGCSW